MRRVATITASLSATYVTNVSQALSNGWLRVSLQRAHSVGWNFTSLLFAPRNSSRSSAENQARVRRSTRPAPEVKITVTEGGPLSVKGPVTLVDQDGNEFDVGGRKRIALCRCGASANKPFCDGAHARIAFEADERAA